MIREKMAMKERMGRKGVSVEVLTGQFARILRLLLKFLTIFVEKQLIVKTWKRKGRSNEMVGWIDWIAWTIKDVEEE